MEEMTNQRNRNLWLGIGRISLDILTGTAVVAVLSYMLWLLEPNFFLLEKIWGVELTRGNMPGAFGCIFHNTLFRPPRLKKENGSILRFERRMAPSLFQTKIEQPK
jgi:hypothetical protein